MRKLLLSGKTISPTIPRLRKDRKTTASMTSMLAKTSTKDVYFGGNDKQTQHFAGPDHFARFVVIETCCRNCDEAFPSNSRLHKTEDVERAGKEA